ncbi:MAG: hypothetical protein IPP51_15455 [Bacteroidetes bacterium]|nr:hypothetical protein [Bacteroidota bacterium]
MKNSLGIECSDYAVSIKFGRAEVEGDFPAGVYVCEVLDGKNIVKVLKVVAQ